MTYAIDFGDHTARLPDTSKATATSASPGTLPEQGPAVTAGERGQGSGVSAGCGLPLLRDGADTEDFRTEPVS